MLPRRISQRRNLLTKKDSQEDPLTILKADLENATNSVRAHSEQLLMLKGVCSYLAKKINDIEADEIKP